MERPKKTKGFPAFMSALDNVGAGWHPLIEDLEADLLDIDPEYTLTQVKEKFGGLRYYATPSNLDVYEAFHARIGRTEAESYKVCEECGTRDDVTTEGGWLRTMCPPCRSRLAQERAERWQKRE